MGFSLPSGSDSYLNVKKILLLAILWSTFSQAFSQSKTISGKLETQAGLLSDDVPFWMRSNQFGSTPLSGPSISLIGNLRKDYDTVQVKFFDWGAGIEGRANGGKGSNLTLIEGYGKIKLGIFELKGGRMKETFGLTDTLLTTGNFAISGNALGVPKVQLAIPEFYAIPFFGKLIAFKGIFAQGWLGEKAIQEKRVDRAVTYFHQKALYIKIGKPEWKFRLYGGFNDQVFWGQEAKIFESFTLSGWEKYQSVVLGKNWAFSKVGNHVGNIDLRLEYDFKKFRLSGYRQNFYEVGALYHLANIADGITGLSFQNTTARDKKIYWKKFLFEFLYTKNQAGEAWSKPTPTGNENYLNHYLYRDGWSYFGLGLGTPFITRAMDTDKWQPANSRDYFSNNRVAAFHFGGEVTVRKVDLLTKISYSRNFGTHDVKNYIGAVNQFSAYLEGKRRVAKNIDVGAILAIDAGQLLHDSGGLIIKASLSL